MPTYQKSSVTPNVTIENEQISLNIHIADAGADVPGDVVLTFGFTADVGGRLIPEQSSLGLSASTLPAADKTKLKQLLVLLRDEALAAVGYVKQ